MAAEFPPESNPLSPSVRDSGCGCLCLPALVRNVRRRRRTPAVTASPEPAATIRTTSFGYSGAPAVVPGHDWSLLLPGMADKHCRKLLKNNGHPSKILLYAEEGWARSASSSYWTVTPTWWSNSRCHVVEVSGTRRHSTRARLIDNGMGTLCIIGSFKKMNIDCDFKLCLTSNVTISDFNMGYSMTGTLERGCKKSNSFQITHFAVIRRKEDFLPSKV